LSTAAVMLTRVVSAGAALLCAGALLGGAAGAASAKEPRAGTSVIGGRAASLQEWGFTAAIVRPDTLCTGIVLSPNKVLTTAHCVANPSTLVVRTNSTSAFAGGEVSSVSSAAIAPGYAGGFQNDLAMLTLTIPTTAPPIQLASAADEATYTRVGAPLAVAGFGNRNPLLGRGKVGILTTADVQVRRCLLPAWAICDSGGRAGTAFRRLRDRLLRRKVKKAVCSGDSGGPLVARTPAGPRLIGIAEASAGPRKPNPFYFVICGLKGFPSLHSRASSYLTFIQGNL
jgi:secreted trypsin-like serine protease